jgi:hypothetical protein
MVRVSNYLKIVCLWKAALEIKTDVFISLSIHWHLMYAMEQVLSLIKNVDLMDIFFWITNNFVRTTITVKSFVGYSSRRQVDYADWNWSAKTWLNLLSNEWTDWFYLNWFFSVVDLFLSKDFERKGWNIVVF